MERTIHSNKFDPFSDRCARDIRNQLAVAFVKALKFMDSSCFEIAAENFLTDHPDGIYHDYVARRLQLYRHAFNTIQNSEINALLQQAPILWNYRLFFEVHELLEEIWHAAEEPAKQALKGFIQAAGVYIHLEQGNRKAATRLSKKAIIHLQAAGHHLSGIGGVADLIGGLSRLDSIPPSLKRI